ncbi:Fur-regulated basic protein FbpA [Niallia sp. 03133]|uniref:Fur-regulated basic protein FbpA n=1 Tax=Niallia sp. 03133 TaxID=3458060 RepID=UPI004044F5B1
MAQLRKVVEQRKEELIKKLIALGVYKKDGHHLYSLTLSEIEAEYHKELKKIN